MQSHWTKPLVIVDWQTLLTDSLTYFNVSVGLRHMIHFLFFQTAIREKLLFAAKDALRENFPRAGKTAICEKTFRAK